VKGIESQLVGIKQRAELKQWIDELPDGAELMAVARYDTKEESMMWSLRGFARCGDAGVAMLAAALQYAMHEEFGL
jgi:hypothetical protein